jgi:hypothetical protein
MLGLMAYVLKFETENDNQPRDNLCERNKSFQQNFYFLYNKYSTIPFLTHNLPYKKVLSSSSWFSQIS